MTNYVSSFEERLISGRRLLGEAVELTRICKNFWRDEESTRTKTRIHFAVDTDVLVMYANPERDAQAGFYGRRAPGMIFSGSESVKEGVIALLGDFVLRRFDPTICDARQTRTGPAEALLAFQPHYDEQRRVVFAMLEDFAQKASSERELLERGRGELQSMIAGLTPDEAAVKLLEELKLRTPTAAAWLNGTLPTELLRQLPRGRVVPPQFHSAFREGSNSLRMPPGRVTEGRHEELRELATEWDKLLRKQIPVRNSHTANLLEDDAWSLAYLEWFNFDAVARNLDRRLVLVTSSALILSAGVEREAAHPEFDNFAEAYLRDVRSMLGAQHFFVGAESDQRALRFRNMKDLLRVLYPEAIRQTFVDTDVNEAEVTVADFELDRSSLESIDVEAALQVLVKADQHAESEAPFPQSVLTGWQQLITDTRAQMVIERTAARSHSLADGLKEGDINIDAFVDELMRRMRFSFADLYLSMGVIGVEQLLEPHRRVRGLPALRFGNRYPMSQAIATDLSALMFHPNRTADFDMAAVYNKLRIEDEINYHAHVLHAFVYASSGKWHQARTLCKVALFLVDTLPTDQRREGRGREAAYLMAIAERRLAANEPKLELARQALELARARGRELGSDSDIRFDSEDFAQEIAELQMRHFSGTLAEAIDVATYVARATDISNRVDAPREPIDCVRHWVIRQSITNGLVAALIASSRGQKFPAVIGSIRFLLRRMSDEGLAPSVQRPDLQDHPYADEVSDFVWLIAAACYGDRTVASYARTLLIRQMESPTLIRPWPLEGKRREGFVRLALGETDWAQSTY